MNYWKRYITFTIGSKEFAAPFEMKFSTSFNMKGGGLTTAGIYNPSEETIESVEPKGNVNQTIIIDAGYEKDHGICVMGEIYQSSVTSSGCDSILEMKISDAVTSWANARVSRTWQKDVKAGDVVNEMVSMFGLDSGKVAVGTEKSYPRGLSFNTKLKQALEYMAKETDSDFFIRNGRIYFQPSNDEGIKTGVLLSPETGLLGSPEKNGNNLSIKSLFNYRLGAGEFISLESDRFKGDFKIISGTHFFTAEDAYTQVEATQV